MPEVVVPWLPGCPHRERAWEYVRPRLEQIGPVTLAHGPRPWVKALAVMPAVAGCAEGEIVVVADADVWCEGIPAAIQAVRDGAAWSMPHGQVYRLTEAGTAAVLEGADWRGQPTCQKPYAGMPGGGIVVALRETLLDVCPDPRFVGWGQEDESWAMALTTLVGPPWRGNADLVHCWHPPQERLCRRRGTVDGWNLRRRYIRARHDQRAMRLLLDEAKDALALSTHQPAMHDHPPDLVGHG